MYKVGEIIEVEVTGIESYGIFVKADNDYTGLIHISEIKGDYYNFDDVTKSLRGEKKGKILTYINLIEKGALNVDEAARYADMSVKALKKEAKRLGASL